MDEGAQRWVLRAALVAAVAYLAAFYGMRDAYNKSRPWLGAVVHPAEVEAARWMGLHLPEDAIVNGDIFGGETYMAIANVRNGVGGDWFLVNDSDQWMWDCQHIFTSHSAKEAFDLATKRRMAYVLVPPTGRSVHCGYGWKGFCTGAANEEECVDRAKFADERYFRLAYRRDGVDIWRVVGVDEEAWPFEAGLELAPGFTPPHRAPGGGGA